MSHSSLESLTDEPASIADLEDVNPAPGTPSSEPAVSPATTPASAPDQAPSRLFWRVFGSTFLTIFLAEFGDKTQITTLLMSAESQAPWIVFAGAGTALVTTSLLGVIVGCWLANRLSPKTIETAAGIMLLGISALLLWDVIAS